MSDFLTRLVERQAGIGSRIQPRTPSMFAPPESRSESADLSVTESSIPLDGAIQPPPDSFRPRVPEQVTPSETALRENQGANHHSRSAPRATEETLGPTSAPTPLVRNGSAVVNQPASVMSAASLADSLTTPEQRPPRQAGLSGQSMQDPGNAAVDRSPACIAPPPRLVETRHDTPQPFPAAPPSLRSGMVSGLRTARNPEVSAEPPVEVTIGRIEVTAVSAAPDRKHKAGSRRPAMSLDEYLSRRQGGRP